MYDYQIKHVLSTCQPQGGKEVKASCDYCTRSFSLDAESYTYTIIKIVNR